MTTYADVAILKSDGYVGIVWRKGRCYYQLFGSNSVKSRKGGYEDVNIIGRIDDVGKKHYVSKKDFRTRMKSLSFIEAFRITARDIIGLETM